MKKILNTTVYLSLIFGFIGLTNDLRAQEEKKERTWPKHVAAASYGLSLAFLDVDYFDRGNVEQYEGLLMPGIDFRHFNGVNVSEGGGFYYGYEVGAGVNFNSGGQSFSVLPGQATYEINSVVAYRLFLMGKHGYRFNISDKPDGFSLGLELGLGVLAGGSDIEFVDTQQESLPTYSLGDGGASPVVEIGLEGAFQVKDNSRFTVRLALTVGDSFLETSYGEVGAGGIRASMQPPFVNLRFGFRMFHDK